MELKQTNLAIAFDAVTGSILQGGSTTLTFSHTCSGTDRILFVAANTRDDDGAAISSVTYGGVAMTFINVSVLGISNYRLSLYYLIAPSTGANNVVITKPSSTGDIMASAASYTGVKQTSQPDASTTATGSGSPVTTNLTTIADNSWAVLAASNIDSDFVSGTNATLRSTTIKSTAVIADTNGPKTPAGSLSMTLTYSGTRQQGTVMASFAPAVAASTNSKFFQFM